VPLMPPIPMAGHLVPAQAPALPPSFTLVQQPLTAGLPFTFALDAHWSVTLRYPTGVMLPWLDADPHAVASSDASERAAPAAAAGVTLRDPVRVAVARNGATRAVVPLSAGRRALVVDDGVRPAALEIVIERWTIAAGTVCGPGDFGSSLALAWRDASAAIDVFATPPLQPLVVLRLPRQVTPVLTVRPFVSVTAKLIDRELVSLGSLPIRREVGWL
jgi:hypothetical protein